MTARAIRLLARRNLERRAIQSLLVGVTIWLSVLLFFVGFGLLAELRGPFERMFEAQRGSHLELSFDSRAIDPREVRDWWQQQPGLEAMSPLVAVRPLTESASKNGEEIARLLFLAERPAVPIGMDDLRFDGAPPDESFCPGIEHDGSCFPAAGEVWVPTSVADVAGLSAGDLLELPTSQGLASFVVGAVVVDPQYSAPFNNPSRLWVGPGELVRHYELRTLSRVSLAMRFDDPSRVGELWPLFLESRGGVFGGDFRDYDAALLGYTAPYSLMAAMLIAFALLSVVLAGFAIWGTITSSILADFRLIGIWRSQGFRPADIVRLYRLQYLLLAAVAVPLGLIVGVPLVRVAVGLLMSSTRTTAEGSTLVWLALVTLILFLGGVHLFVSRVARRADRIRPAEAIRWGGSARSGVMSSAPSAATLQPFGVPFLVAVKTLLRQRRRSVLLALSVVFATLAASLTVHLDHSLRQTQRDPSLLGFDRADVRVTRGGQRFAMRHEQLMAELLSHPRVEAVATSDFVNGVLLFDPAEPGRDLVGTLVDGDIDALSYRNLDGRNPVGPAEVSVGVATAREFGLVLGDEIDLWLSGRAVSLDVVGIFQTINNGGTGFRVRLEAFRLADPLYEPSQYGVVLAEGSPDAFIEELEAEFGEAVDAQPGDRFVRDILETVTTGMRVSNGFLALVLLAASAFLVFNTTVAGLAENRQLYGVLKTVGLTPAQLRRSVLFSVGLLACLGVAVGTAVWVLGAPWLLSLLFSGLGLVSFPLHNSVIGAAILAPAVVVVCLLSGWLPSRRLSNVSSRTLVIE